MHLRKIITSSLVSLGCIAVSFIAGYYLGRETAVKQFEMTIVQLKHQRDFLNGYVNAKQKAETEVQNHHQEDQALKQEVASTAGHQSSEAVQQSETEE